ncbi:MAG TPA: inositol monophosphatase [Candidatus Saccharimonadales bacterium]|nr:inositol monophosphatase [Candidatus Saccharimonadales bacterium]
MSYGAELAFAKELAGEAGEIMRQYFRSEDINTEWKEDNSPLTVADTTINSLVIERVKKKFPGHGVIGEEESLEASGGYVWVVDPIDGTVPFSLGVPISTFSIALVDRSDGQPVVAVVYDPFLDHLYTAEKDKGVFLNGKRLKTDDASSLKQKYVFVAGWLGHKSVFDPHKCIEDIRSQKGKIISVASFIYFGSKIASGELVGAISDGSSVWDVVTVRLFVEEAGGIMTDYNGDSQRYDGPTRGMIAASNKKIHGQLLKIVNEARI